MNMGIVLHVVCADDGFDYVTNARNAVIRAILRWVAEDVCTAFERYGRVPTRSVYRGTDVTLYVRLRNIERSGGRIYATYNVKPNYG